MYLAVCDDNREELETVLSLLGCFPMNDGFDEPERMEFAETAALCVYYRGAYEGAGAAIRALTEYVRENSVQVTGPFRSIYLEGLPSRGVSVKNVERSLRGRGLVFVSVAQILGQGGLTDINLGTFQNRENDLKHRAPFLMVSG